VSADRYEKRYGLFNLADNDNIGGESIANIGIVYAKNRREASEEMPTYVSVNEASTMIKPINSRCFSTS
jgi:hypothetical protein